MYINLIYDMRGVSNERIVMQYEIIQGDCIKGMNTLPAQSVHCVVTSPPYYGLRDYGTASWQGGNDECDHKGKPLGTRANINNNTGGRDVKNALYFEPFKDFCAKCGAMRIDQQIGLEETPEAYVSKLVEVFRAVRRILRDDGTVWLNLGDSYAGSGGSGNQFGQIEKGLNPYKQTGKPINIGLKPKDLIGIPWRVAFALQADGWYLRQDIIWHKPNPMPESVTDRCTKSHEYIFLLSKNEHYYYDNEAIKEQSNKSWNSAAGFSPNGKRANTDYEGFSTQNQFNGTKTHTDEERTGRNKRSVWTVNVKGYAEAHFATYPVKLIEPCILAGCPESGTVFDPFSGSGTTGLVAMSNNRNYIGTELNPEYVEISHKRLSAIQPKLF